MDLKRERVFNKKFSKPRVKRIKIEQLKTELRKDENFKIEDIIQKFVKRISPEEIDIQFDKKLGTGSYGIVYLAKYQGKTCAIKLIYLSSGDHRRPLLNKEIQRELFIAHKMEQYSGFIKVHGFYLEERLLGIVMRVYKRMEDVREKMNNEQVFQVIKRVAKLISILHSERILHRDIKLQNILCEMDKNGLQFSPVMSDFGLSKIKLNYQIKQKQKRDSGSFSPFSPSGSVPNYKWQPLEVIKENKYTLKSDIYSFGMTIIEIITNQLPWEKNTDFDIVTSLEEGKGPEQLNLLSEPWQEIVKCCCSKDPKSRPSALQLYNFMKEFEEELIDFLPQSLNEIDQMEKFSNSNLKKEKSPIKT